MTLYRVTVKTLGGMACEFTSADHAKTWVDANIPFEYGPMIKPFYSNGFYTVCAWCGLILNNIEEKEDIRVMEKMELRFSHGICKDCRKGILI
jgi:hypothetical protein